MMETKRYPLAMAKEFWENSQLSIARYYGRIRLGNYEYVICNKDGKDIFACSLQAEKAGRAKAIEPGEPADLVRTDVLPIYRKLGREKFLQFCNENRDVWTIKEIRRRLKEWQQN